MERREDQWACHNGRYSLQTAGFCVALEAASGHLYNQPRTFCCQKDGLLSDKTEHPPIPDAFAALGVRPSILRALAEASFTVPSDIQNLLIPRALAGVDILGQARTGTGKTAAFAIPILQRCERGLATQAIMLVPTRELCMQVETEVKRLGQ